MYKTKIDNKQKQFPTGMIPAESLNQNERVAFLTMIRAEKKTIEDLDKQIQEILNKCIELGWKPWGGEYLTIHIFKEKIFFWSNELPKERLGYHDLFSKDSGLMEFVEWKKEEDAFLIISGKGRDRDVWYNNGEYHYMIMGPMTAEEKIQYFLDNVIIPTP